MDFVNKNVNLAEELIRTDFKLRYHGSYLGYLWSFLKPLMTFGVLYVVFSKFLRVDYPDYPLYLFLGIILWNFFAEATAGAMSSILEKGGLMKKVYFPREIIIFSSIGVSFAVFLSNFAVYAVFYLFLKGIFAWEMLFFFLCLLELLIIAMGVGLFLAALCIKFRDLLHMWQVFLQIGFWATPVVYSWQTIPEKYQTILLLNPLTTIFNDSRLALINHQTPDLVFMLYGLAVSIIIIAVGYSVFLKRMPFFAEEI